MPSKSYEKLAQNKGDLDILWSLHAQLSGGTPGRKHGVEPLNKAVVVFVCAAWEAYCEDIIEEAISYVVADCNDPAKLPKELKKQIAKAIREDKNEIAPWDLASAGWKQVLQQNAQKFIKSVTGHWNTPKPGPIDELFLKSLGIDKISDKWVWQNCDAYSAREKLDKFVTLRGDIAHRLDPNEPVHLSDGKEFYDHIERIAGIIDGVVSNYLVGILGKRYW